MERKFTEIRDLMRRSSNEFELMLENISKSYSSGPLDASKLYGILQRKQYSVYMFQEMKFGLKKEEIEDISEELIFLMDFYFKNKKTVEKIEDKKEEKKKRIKTLRERAKHGKNGKKKTD